MCVWDVKLKQINASGPLIDVAGRISSTSLFEEYKVSTVHAGTSFYNVDRANKGLNIHEHLCTSVAINKVIYVSSSE